VSEQAAEKRTTEQRIADLELQLAQSRAAVPGSTLPEHSAGVGLDVAETWSQQDQELAYMGDHPDQEPPRVPAHQPGQPARPKP
jgi:hypothetical protein